jgi:hypothetical protein
MRPGGVHGGRQTIKKSQKFFPPKTPSFFIISSFPLSCGLKTGINLYFNQRSTEDAK